MIDEQRLREVLEVVMRATADFLSIEEFCLVGTASALLRGVPLPTGDIDFLMRDRKGVDSFSSALGDYPCQMEPTLLNGSVQYYAAFQVNGVKVEASTVEAHTDSHFMEVCGEGPWKHQSLIECGDFLIPTVALELRLSTEFSRGRPDRSGPILEHFMRYGCDRILLEAAMAAHGLAEKHQEIRAQLAGVGSQPS